MTIQYTEKGLGLHADLERAGLPIVCRDGVWLATGDEAMTQVVIDAYTVQDAIDYRVGEVEQVAELLRASYLKSQNYGPMEQSTFGMKLYAVAGYIQKYDAATTQPEKDAVDPGLWLMTQCQKNCTAPIDYARKVITAAATLEVVEGYIGGAADVHKSQLRALTTFEEVAAYDIEAGWPPL